MSSPHPWRRGGDGGDMFLVSAGGQGHSLGESGVNVSKTAPDCIHGWSEAKEGERERESLQEGYARNNKDLIQIAGEHVEVQ